MLSWLLRIATPLFALALLVLTSLAHGHGAASNYEEDVEAMYIAYYGRPGEPTGVEFWAEELAAAEGDLSAIIDAFGNSTEYNQRFAEYGTDELIDNLYQQLFGRNADDQGRQFYAELLQSGQRSLASIALDIYNGAQGLDALIIDNKITVAHSFTDHVLDNSLDYGDGQIDAARALLASVSETNDSVAQAAAILEDIFNLAESSNCSEFEGSFDRIQSIVFDGYNCTNSACHAGANPSGELDLSADVAYRNLFRVAARASLSEPMQLVYPGEQSLSFLYQKLAAATDGTELPTGGGTAMPLGGAISADHLEALRLWIRAGAPEYDDVDNVATLLGCSVGTAPKANKILPPDPPGVGEGLQFVSGPWTVLSNSENEVCYATYYDLDQVPGAVPDSAKVDCSGGALNNYEGECFAYNERVLTQDPQSHHSIIDVYVGDASPLDPGWGSWQCLNGPSEGLSCDPTRINEPVADGGADCGGPLYVCGTVAKRSIACTGWGAQDRRQNLVSMGGSQAPISSSKLTEGVYSVLPTKGVITWNSHAFNLTSEDTTVEQYNNFWFAPEDGRVYRNQAIFDSKDIFIANVPPFEQRTYCSTTTLPQGAQLTELGSHAHKRGVLWQTWLPPQDPSCKTQTGCQPNTEPADYLSRVYNDPLVINYDPPRSYNSAEAAERTVKYCVTYDNGKDFPELLKRSSNSVGTTCNNSAFCVGGATPGLSCGSDDSLCGDGGSCDACTVRGGFTTEDEMMILLGNYYVIPVE